MLQTFHTCVVHAYICDKAIFVTYNYQVFNNTLYWEWLRNNSISGVYPGAWYNGLQEENSSYIGDKCSILVGMPRIRQLRVKPGKLIFRLNLLGLVETNSIDWLVGSLKMVSQEFSVGSC